MAYLLSNIYTKNCWNQTTTVKIIVGGWVIYFFGDTVYICGIAFSAFVVRHLLDLLQQGEDNRGRHANNPDGLPPHPD